MTIIFILLFSLLLLFCLLPITQSTADSKIAMTENSAYKIQLSHQISTLNDLELDYALEKISKSDFDTARTGILKEIQNIYSTIDKK